MTIDNPVNENDAARREGRSYHFDRHTPEYRLQFEAITEDMQSRCPVAWSETYGGHWVASGHQEVFDIARSADLVSNDKDLTGERPAYQGISIPSAGRNFRGGFLEMDPPAQRHYRQTLKPLPVTSCGRTLDSIRRRDRSRQLGRADRKRLHRFRR